MLPYLRTYYITYVMYYYRGLCSFRERIAKERRFDILRIRRKYKNGEVNMRRLEIYASTLWAEKIGRYLKTDSSVL